MPGKFSTIFHKRANFCDFLFTFLQNKGLPRESKFFPFNLL